MGNENFENEKEEKSFTIELFDQMKLIIKTQWTFIFILIAIIVGLSVYHEYQWSQFDTIIVDSKDGGNANYVGNDGSVTNYGKDLREATEKLQQEEVEGVQSQDKKVK